jgi:hypothetical protein
MGLKWSELSEVNSKTANSGSDFPNFVVRLELSLRLQER